MFFIATSVDRLTGLRIAYNTQSDRFVIINLTDVVMMEGITAGCLAIMSAASGLWAMIGPWLVPGLTRS